MLVLDFAFGIPASVQPGFRSDTLLFQKAHQASRQSPETQYGLSGHQLVMIAAQEVLVILEEGLDVSTDRQDVDQELCVQVEQCAAEVAHGFQRFVQVVASD